jgi:recombination protein RecA
MAPPFRQIEFDIIYGKGISTDAELIEIAEARGLVTRSGSWYTMGDTRLGQGRDKAREFLLANPAVQAQLRHTILAAGAVGMVPVLEA